jgi:hypothetical protein
MKWKEKRWDCQFIPERKEAALQVESCRATRAPSILSSAEKRRGTLGRTLETQSSPIGGPLSV